MRPVIGISCYGERAAWGAWDVDAVVLHRAYVDALEASGAAVVVVPPVYDEPSVDAIVGRLDGIVIAGGADLTDALATVLVYAPGADTWTAGPDLPAPRWHPMGVADASGAPVVIGGLATLDATQPLADVLALVGGAWVPRTSMPTARGGCSLAVIDGVVYCAGGEAGGTVIRATEGYDLAADTWAALPDLPLRRGGTGGAARDGRLVVAGGAHKYAWEPTDDVDLYDPAAPM